MTKRLADWLEKVSVAAFAVGVFQGSFARTGNSCFGFGYVFMDDKAYGGQRMTLTWIVAGVMVIGVGLWGLYLTRKHS